MPSDADAYDYGSDWTPEEIRIWEETTDGYGDLTYDREAQTLYHTAYFAEGIPARDRDYLTDYLQTYVRDEYGMNWDNEFDWEAYREWYDATSG